MKKSKKKVFDCIDREMESEFAKDYVKDYISDITSKITKLQNRFADINRKRERRKIKDIRKFSNLIEKNDSVQVQDKIVLKHSELGSLSQIENMLWKEMLKEVERNGYSELTLNMEGAVNGIREIIDLNNIEEERHEAEKMFAIAGFITCGVWITLFILFATKTIEPNVLTSAAMSATLAILTFGNALESLQEKSK